MHRVQFFEEIETDISCSHSLKADSPSIFSMITLLTFGFSSFITFSLVSSSQSLNVYVLTSSYNKI